MLVPVTQLAIFSVITEHEAMQGCTSVLPVGEQKSQAQVSSAS